MLFQNFSTAGAARAPPLIHNLVFPFNTKIADTI